MTESRVNVAIITGGRDYQLDDDAWNWLYDELAEHNTNFIMVGDCPTGVDAAIRRQMLEPPNTFWEGAVFRAAWLSKGLPAGPRRNRWMAFFGSPHNTICIAFPGGKGTRSMEKAAREKGIRIVTYRGT